MTSHPRLPLFAGLLLAALALAGLALSLADRARQRSAASGRPSPTALAAPSDAAPHADAPADLRGRSAAALELDESPDAARAESPGDLAFDRAALYGTVADLDGKPIAGANVGVWRADGKGAALARAASDGAGRFRLEELEPQPSYHVLCEAEGCVPEQRSGRLGFELSIMLAPGAPFAGVVRDAATREPLAGIELAIGPIPSPREDGLAEEIAALSGADGAFAFASVPLEGKLHVTARARTLAPSRHVFEVRSDQRSGYEVLLPARRKIALEVREAESGRPVAGALLDIKPLGRSLELPTDAAGRVSFMLADPSERTFTVEVGREGWCTTRALVDLAPALAQSGVRVALWRGVRVWGRVVDSKGQPGAGADLEVKGTMSGAVQRDVAIVPRAHPDVQTDAEGRFDLSGLLPSEQMTVRAVHPSLGRSEWRPVSLRDHGDEASVELVLQAGAVIEGRVTADGEPVRGFVRWETDGDAGNAFVNDGGEYRIANAPPGEVRLRAHGLGGSVDGPFDDPARKNSAALVVEAGRTYAQDFDLGATATIRGRVLEHSGAPAAHVALSAAGKDGEGHKASLNGHTGPDGTFALLTVASDFTFTVSAVRDIRLSFVEQAGVVPGGPELELVLPPTGTLRLAVVDARSGASLPWCTLYWRPSGEPTFRSAGDLGRPGPDGICTPELPAGLLDLRVSAVGTGYVPATIEGVLVDPSTPSPIVRAALEQGVRLEVAMRPLHADGGRPPYGLVLATQSERAELAAEAEAAAIFAGFARREVLGARRLDRDGTTDLLGLAPGTYAWYGLEEGLAVEPAEIVVPAVEHHRAEFVWRRGEAPAAGEREQ